MLPGHLEKCPHSQRLLMGKQLDSLLPTALTPLLQHCTLSAAALLSGIARRPGGAASYEAVIEDKDYEAGHCPLYSCSERPEACMESNLHRRTVALTLSLELAPCPGRTHSAGLGWPLTWHPYRTVLKGCPHRHPFPGSPRLFPM